MEVDLQSLLRTQASDQLADLKAHSLKFLENVKDCFGEHSSQLRGVHETLGAFKLGNLSKRKAHKSILDLLEGHKNLRQEFINIFMHPAAAWAPGDFHMPTAQPTQPLLEPAPQFLQPAYEPQIRLPSISSSWFLFPQNDRSVEMTISNESNGDDPVVSTTTLPVHAPFGLHNLPDHSWMDHGVKSTSTAVPDDVPVLPPIHSALRNPWDSTYMDTGISDGMVPPQCDASIGGLFGSKDLPSPFNSDMPQPSVVIAQDEEPYERSTLPLQEIPRSVHTPQLTCALLRPSSNHNYSTVVTLENKSLLDIQLPLFPTFQSSYTVQQSLEAVKPEHHVTTEQAGLMRGPFIHALCGKGFASLSGVRKHHWGKKRNDIATTTGCWAKHKKPNIAWNDHPSCKEEQSASEMTRLVPSAPHHSQPESSTSELSALPAQDRPRVPMIPGFPTLDDLPHTVANTLHAGNASIYNARQREHVYHNYQDSSRSSFDNLLSAVNVVPRLDAPKTQDWTNTIAIRLDAQVPAAEQHTLLTPFAPLNCTFNVPYVRSDALDAPDKPSPGVERSGPSGLPKANADAVVDDQEQLLATSSDTEASCAAEASSRSLKTLETQPPGSTGERLQI